MDDEGEMIELDADQLQQLIYQYERRRDGLDPGEPILDDNGVPFELNDEEYEAALEQL